MTKGADAELLLGSGSNWSPPVRVAVFVSAPGISTAAVMSSVALAPSASAPTVHKPVASAYVPCDGAAETNASPDGNASVIATPVALLDPLLVAMIVKVTFSPTFGAIGPSQRQGGGD